MANGISLVGKSLDSDSIVEKLKGELDSRVRLKVYRRGEKELTDFVVKRSNIPIKSVDAAYMLTPQLGYIKINRFAESTFKEFKQALDKLQDQGATKLALDLTR